MVYQWNKYRTKSLNKQVKKGNTQNKTADFLRRTRLAL